ncbi:MAG: T9SS type A sorting domain-containing protein [Saprospiraceae bacterium]|nr:T9SS type A sorting domain-containing protein [Saprospiraceae bacterium]
MEKTFENIVFVEGAGNSLETIDYYFNDKNPNVGLNYYRLKQMDFDGAFEYSNIVVMDFKKANTIVVYPNPTTERLTITTDIQAMVNVRIFSVNSQLMYQNTQQIDNQMDINLSDLPVGNYYLIINKEGTAEIIYSGNFIKR